MWTSSRLAYVQQGPRRYGVTHTASGRSQTDGPTTPSDRDRTEASRALVAGFAEKALVGADYSVLTDYISTDTYRQHNPEAADGLDGFGASNGLF